MNIREVTRRLRRLRSDYLRQFKPGHNLGRLRELVPLHWQRKCAMCGLSETTAYAEGKYPVLRIAHIKPREEGGRNGSLKNARGHIMQEGPFSDNLILLCERDCKTIEQARDERKSVGYIGCHDLYDKEGAWTRESIRWLTTQEPGSDHGLIRPTSAILTAPLDDVKELQVLSEKKLSSRHYPATPMQRIKKLLREARADEKEARNAETNATSKEDRLRLAKERLALENRVRKLVMCGYRLARRSLTWTDSNRAVKDVALFESEAANIEASLSPEDAAILQYERGMIEFQFYRFEKAQELMEASPSRVVGSAINLSQGAVCRFEAVRVRGEHRGADIEEVKECIASLERLKKDIDKLAKRKNSAGARKTWPVTIRLHIARMLAYLNDLKPDDDYVAAARKYVDEAERGADPLGRR